MLNSSVIQTALLPSFWVTSEWVLEPLAASTVNRHTVTRYPSRDIDSSGFWHISKFGLVHLYPCLPVRCGQKTHKSKGDRQCKIGQKENVSLFCSYVFSVRTGQADRGINPPIKEELHLCMQELCMQVTMVTY